MDTASTIEMLLMTKSSKYGEYCAAGFDLQSGRFIRLVSMNVQTHGAISKEMLYDPVRRRYAEVLDKVRVPIIGEKQDRIQIENMLIDAAHPIRIIGRATIKEAMQLHACENRDALFGSRQYIVEEDPEKLGHSLEFIKASNVHIYKMYTSSGKPRHKIDFECGGHAYSQFAMTDPVYYKEENRRIEQAALVLSISDDEWSRMNGHYIYAAAILELGIKGRRRRIRRTVLRRVFAAIILCVMTGIWIGLQRAPCVLIPPHSGAKYHINEQCDRLNNPSAAYRLPLPLARLLFEPCTQCAAESIETYTLEE